MPSTGWTRRRATNARKRRQRVGRRRSVDRQVRRERVDAQRAGSGSRPIPSRTSSRRRGPTPRKHSARGARRPRPTRAGRPDRRRRAAGRPRSASRDRRHASRAAGWCRRCRRGASPRQAERVRGGHGWSPPRRCGGRRAPRIRTAVRPGTKGRAFRGATLIRRMPHSPDRRVGRGSVTVADRRCPVSLALCAGAYWGGGARRSVRRLPGPFPFVAAPVSTNHRVSGPTCDGYSSRSSPVLRDVGGV